MNRLILPMLFMYYGSCLGNTLTQNLVSTYVFITAGTNSLL